MILNLSDDQVATLLNALDKHLELLCDVQGGSYDDPVPDSIWRVRELLRYVPIMTTPREVTPLEQMVWSNAKIDECISEYIFSGHTARGLCRRVSCRVRDSYEVLRLMDETILHNLRERNADLEVARAQDAAMLFALTTTVEELEAKAIEEHSWYTIAQQRIAALEAQLAAEQDANAKLRAELAEAYAWQPVPRREPFNGQGDYVMGMGQGRCIWMQCTVNGAIWHGVPLGENIELVQRIAASGDVTP